MVFFQQTCIEYYIKNIGDYFAIFCALINACRPLFIAEISKDSAIADRVLRLVNQSNNIKNYVDKLENKSEKSLKWTVLIHCELFG